MTADANMDYRRCAFAHSASLMLQDWFVLDITAKRLSEIIGDKMDYEVSEYLYDPNDPHIDTNIRDEVVDIVSNHYLGANWPRYRDKVDMNQFHEELKKAIENETA